jgi:putative ABC transport system ATP-binding protein
MSLTPDQQAINSIVINVSSKICEEMSIAFSANDANQSLADIQADNDGDVTTHTWEMLSAVGQRIGVKYRSVESNFRDLMLAIKETGPIVIALKPMRETESPRVAVILRRNVGSQISIYLEETEQQVSRSWLKKNALLSEGGLFCWQLAQPMFAAAEASAYNYRAGTKDKPLSPLKRFVAFLRPEAPDIRAVVIFAVFVGILSLTTPLAVEALVNTIGFGRYLQPLLILTLIMFIFLAFRAGLSVMMTIVVEIIQRRIFVRVVDDLAVRLTRVPLPYLKSHHGPELVNRFFDVVNLQKVTAKLLLESVMLVLQTVIGLTVLAFYHPFLLGYDIGLIAMMAIVLYVMGRGAVKTAKSESALKYETAAWLQEIVRHPTTFKFNGGLGFALNRSDELAGRYIQSRTDHFKILLRQISFSMAMQAIAATALLGLGGYLVIEGQLTLGQLVAAELIVTVILGSFAKIGKDLESFYDLLASVDKLGKLFDLPGEPADRLQLTPHDGAAAIQLVDLKFLNGRGSAINANVEAGKSVAIVGKAGAGKTKIIETIAGLHSPVGGYALLNEFRVDLIGAGSLQAQIAFVNDIEIFDGTIEENLRLGRSEINSAAINEIFDRLGLQETVTRMDSGYKTKLSTTGFPLSTSQAVRLVLARALVAKPPALLIDSLLDRLADDDLLEVLSLLKNFEGETTIVIATGRNAIASWATKRWEI